MKTFSYLIIFLSVMIASCGKDKTPENTLSAAEVPNSVGDYWKYNIKSSTGEQKGFLEVRVIKKGTLPDGRPVSTWVYLYPNFTDTIYKISSDTSLEEYTVFPATSGNNYPVMRYVFPAIPGMKWAISSAPPTDSVEVITDTTIIVPAGTMAHSLQLNIIGAGNIGNYWNNSRYWFTPHIGIARMENALFNLGPDKHNGIYELLEYRLK